MKQKDIYTKVKIFSLLGFDAAAVRGALVVLFSLIISAAAVLTLGKLIHYFVDEVLSTTLNSIVDIGSVSYIVIAILFISVSGASRYYFINRFGERLAANLRKVIHEHAMNLSFAAFNKYRASDILTLMLSEVDVAKNIIVTNISSGVRNIILFCGSIFIIMITSTRMFCYSAFAICVIVAPVMILRKRGGKNTERPNDEVAFFAHESMRNYFSTKILAAERYMNERLCQILADYDCMTKQKHRKRAIMVSCVMFMLFSSMIFLAFLGCHEIKEGRMTPGSLSSFIVLVILSVASAGSLTELVPNCVKLVETLRKIHHFLHSNDEVERYNKMIVDEGVTEDSVWCHGNVILRNVVFHYDHMVKDEHNDGSSAMCARVVLQGISAVFPKGEISAIVGESGVGKSTILKLIARLYDVEDGAITIGGANIDDIDIRHLRKNIAYVAQNVELLNDTIFANIAYDLIDISIDDVIKVAKIADIYDFIDSLPKKFDSRLGAEGLELSGGQRQKILIARALLRGTEIILLDEATSAIDVESEGRIYANFAEYVRGKTIIMIAHRHSTLKYADNIFVMDKSGMRRDDNFILLNSQDML